MPRPSRQHQLAHALDATREQMALAKRHLASLQSAERAAATKARNQRRYTVGRLADEAGLAEVDDATLSGLFTLVARLTAAPNPVALLGALLEDVGDTPGTAVPAFGHRGDGAATA